MVESGGRLRLLLEARKTDGIRRELRVDHLQGDLPVQPRVPGPIDLTHPARAERGSDLVWPEAVAGRECHKGLTRFYPWGDCLTDRLSCEPLSSGSGTGEWDGTFQGNPTVPRNHFRSKRSGLRTF